MPKDYSVKGYKCEICNGTVLGSATKDNRLTVLANCEDYDDFLLLEAELKVCRGCAEKLFAKVLA